MKKLLAASAMAICIAATNANASGFSDAVHSYGAAEVKSPVNITGSGDYNVRGDFVVNNKLTNSASGNMHIDGNMVINAPTTLQGSGNLEVNGDLIVQSSLRNIGSGNVIVRGNIVVINGKGSITGGGSGNIEGQIGYADSYEASPTPMAAKKVYHHTNVTTSTGAAVNSTGGSAVSINPNGVFTGNTSITRSGITVR